MGIVFTLVRRSLWLVLVGAVGGGAYAVWRDRSTPKPTGPAEWPPLPDKAANADPHASTNSIAPDAAATASRSSGGSTTVSVVNALVDAPEARSDDASGDWVAPLDDGSCPLTHPIKANDNSGIFHVPDGRFYGRTKAERCYTTADAAVADGYRQSKN